MLPFIPFWDIDFSPGMDPGFSNIRFLWARDFLTKRHHHKVWQILDRKHQNISDINMKKSVDKGCQMVILITLHKQGTPEGRVFFKLCDHM